MFSLVFKSHPAQVTTALHDNPHRGHDGTASITERWARTFCREALNMSYKRPTRTKKHQHDDAFLRTVSHRFLLRLVFLVVTFAVPTELTINMDETGVFLLPLKQRGWAPAGKNTQTVFYGAGDKRQFTTVPSVSAAGHLLEPCLTIWGGKTERCEPDDKVKADFPNLEHAHSESHWSTYDTMKKYIKVLVETYYEPMVEQLGLPAGQKMILILDVFSAHRDAGFLAWLNHWYPMIILLFVPASFTPFLQPLDVAVNFVFKDRISNWATQWFASQVALQISEAEGPTTKVLMDLSLVALKRPFCMAVSKALKDVAGH